MQKKKLSAQPEAVNQAPKGEVGSNGLHKGEAGSNGPHNKVKSKSDKQAKPKSGKPGPQGPPPPAHLPVMSMHVPPGLHAPWTDQEELSEFENHVCAAYHVSHRSESFVALFKHKALRSHCSACLEIMTVTLQQIREAFDVRRPPPGVCATCLKARRAAVKRERTKAKKEEKAAKKIGAQQGPAIQGGPPEQPDAAAQPPPAALGAVPGNHVHVAPPDQGLALAQALVQQGGHAAADIADMVDERNGPPLDDDRIVVDAAALEAAAKAAEALAKKREELRSLWIMLRGSADMFWSRRAHVAYDDEQFHTLTANLSQYASSHNILRFVVDTWPQADTLGDEDENDYFLRNVRKIAIESRSRAVNLNRGNDLKASTFQGLAHDAITWGFMIRRSMRHWWNGETGPAFQAQALYHGRSATTGRSQTARQAMEFNSAQAGVLTLPQILVADAIPTVMDCVVVPFGEEVTKGAFASFVQTCVEKTIANDLTPLIAVTGVGGLAACTAAVIVGAGQGLLEGSTPKDRAWRCLAHVLLGVTTLAFGPKVAILHMLWNFAVGRLGKRHLRLNIVAAANRLLAHKLKGQSAETGASLATAYSRKQECHQTIWGHKTGSNVHKFISGTMATPTMGLVESHLLASYDPSTVVFKPTKTREDGFEYEHTLFEASRPVAGTVSHFGLVGRCVMSPTPDAAGEEVALRARVGKEFWMNQGKNGVIVDAAMEALKECYLPLLKEHVEPVTKPVPLKDWLKSQTPANIRLYEALIADGFTLPEKERLRFKSFLKMETVVHDSSEELETYQMGTARYLFKDPRLIQSPDKRLVLQVGPWLRKAAKAFKAGLMPHCGGDVLAGKHIFYSCGSNARGTGVGWDSLIASVQSTLDADDDLIYLEMDLSRFDAHMQKAAFGALDACYGVILPRHIRRKLLRGKQRGQTAHGIKYSVMYGMCSGMPDTSLGDAIMNAGMQVAVFGARQKWASVVLGDDSATVMSRKLFDSIGGVAGVCDAYQRLGMEAEVILHAEREYVGYCSSRFMCVGGSSVLIPRVGKMLTKLCTDWQCRSGKNADAWLASIATTLLMMGRCDPLLLALGETLRKSAGGVRERVDRDLEFTRSRISGVVATRPEYLEYYRLHYGFGPAEVDACVAELSQAKRGMRSAHPLLLALSAVDC